MSHQPVAQDVLRSIDQLREDLEVLAAAVSPTGAPAELAARMRLELYALEQSLNPELLDAWSDWHESARRPRDSMTVSEFVARHHASDST